MEIIVINLLTIGLFLFIVTILLQTFALTDELWIESTRKSCRDECVQ